MAVNKILGYFLLAAGLLTIVLVLNTSYQIFTGQKSAPQVFYSLDEKSFSKIGSNSSAQEQLQNAVGEQLIKILPSGSISQILNLTCWSAIAFLLIFGGGQIANIGVKLLKKEGNEESE